jgi:hypothetical protein
MKDIFMCLLLNLANHGKLTSAMYDDGFAKITLVNKDNEYDISVIKKAKLEEKKDA